MASDAEGPVADVPETQSPISDLDAPERPVREQLKETSIKSSSDNFQENASSRKRSLEESREESVNDNKPRKRSRNSTPEDPAAPNEATKDTANDAEIDEPSKGLQKKRSHECLETDHEIPATTSATTKDTAGTDATDTKPATDGEREKKRPRDNSQERKPMADNGFATSAFGKAIGASPFASLNKTKETTDPTTQPASTSAFASSSLAAFAGSESSPFGTLGASTSSVFNKSPANSTTNAFAAAASKPSGLSGFSGFASTSKSGGLTSFASSDSPSTLGETKPKPLGIKPFGQASNSDDDDESGDDNEDEQGGNLEAAKTEEQGNTFEAAKTDERFYEQTIATGEESENNVFTCKAKLFHFDKVWKERGIGTFKINVRNVDGKETGRMIMRADGAGRVMLNSPIFKGMSYGDTNNKPPSSKQIMLVGTEEGRTVPLLLRTSNESTAMEVYAHINGLLSE